MINWLLSRLLDVTSMAICAFSQAKEICDCDDSSTFEQTIKVITSEEHLRTMLVMHYLQNMIRKDFLNCLA